VFVVIAVIVIAAVIRAALKRSARMHYSMERVRQLTSPPPMPQVMRPAPITSPGQYPPHPSSVPTDGGFAFNPSDPDAPRGPQLRRDPGPYGRGELRPAAPEEGWGALDVARHHLRISQEDLDTRVRELMSAGNEVAAVRLLCDERDLGIIEAQKYARDLTGAQVAAEQDQAANQDRQQEQDRAASQDRQQHEQEQAARRDRDEEQHYTGSAAIATSTFAVDSDTAWVDARTLDPAGARTEMEALWRNLDEQRSRRQEDDEAGTIADGFQAGLEHERNRIEREF
jgi:hypothetical protein